MADCDDGDVRLVGGNTQYEGRVEVCINRVWGTVCSSRYSYRWWSWYYSSYWRSSPNSNVVCRQLGHMELGTIIFVITYIIKLLLYNRLSYLYNCYSVWTRNRSNTNEFSTLLWTGI